MSRELSGERFSIVSAATASAISRRRPIVQSPEAASRSISS